VPFALFFRSRGGDETATLYSAISQAVLPICDRQAHRQMFCMPAVTKCGTACSRPVQTLLKIVLLGKVSR
jgi:hypothetical protein